MKLASMLFLSVLSFNSFASFIFSLDEISAKNDDNQIAWDFSGFFEYQNRLDVNSYNFKNLGLAFNIYEYDDTGSQSTTTYNVTMDSFLEFDASSNEAVFDDGYLRIDNLLDEMFGVNDDEGFIFTFFDNSGTDFEFTTGYAGFEPNEGSLCLNIGGAQEFCSDSFISVNVPDEYYAQVSAPATMSMFFLVAIGLVLRRMRDL